MAIYNHGRMNKAQISGSILLVIAILAYYLNDTNLPDFIPGILAAVGVGFIFRIIPFKKNN
jgi:uncharacterized membrane protein YjjP (DUF1212 family)